MRILLFCALAASLCSQVIENSVTIIPKADDSATGQLLFREKKANGTNVLKFQAPASLSGDVTWTLPTADGTASQCLVTNGSGVLSFAACTNYWFRSGTTLSPATAGDDLNLSGNITSSSTSGTKDIGSSANKWRDIYIGGTTYTTTLDDNGDANNQIVLAAGLRPSADNTWNVGSSSYRVAGLWVNSIVANTITYASGTGSTVTLYANMAPLSNNNFALGTTSLRWSKVWTTDLDTSGAFTLGGDLTVGGHILSSATTGTKDIGSSTNRFATLYATNIDAAPTSGTTNYVKTRKFEVVDNAGGSTLWDIQVTSNVTTNNFKIRDNSGTYRLELVNKEETTGTTANEARLNYHTVPYAHNTWDLGTTGKRWKDLYLQGSITGAGSATISGTVSTSTLDDISDANNQIVLNAGFRSASDNSLNFGSSGNRIAGIWTNSLTVNTLTYASGTGSTITLYANMAPLSNNNFALGTSSLRWSKVWTTDLDTSGALTLGGDLTVGGHLLSSATTGTKDIGSSTNRFATLYATNIDAAPASGTSNYIKTRKFEVVDNSGGATLWDMQVTSNVTTNNFKIRDNAGTYRLELVNKEETTGTTVNEARLNYHTVPYAHNSWDLGTSAKRWKDLYLQGSATIAGNATVAGTVGAATLEDISDANNQIVLNSGFRPATDDAVNFGSSGKRISGIWTNSLTVNTLTYATGTGSTITLYANMAPFTNNNFALGTTSLRYSKLWVTDIDMSGTCTGCPGTMWARTAGGGIGGAVALISPVTTTDEMGTGRIYPLVTNTHSLGVSTRRWASVWATDFDGSGTLNISGASTLTGNVTFGGNLIPSSNETKTVGTSSSRLDIVYSRRFEANDGTYGRIVLNNPGAGSNSGNAIAVNNASGVSKFYVSYGGTVSTGPISFNGNIYTSADNTYSLGDATYRLANVYSTLGNISSNLTVGGITYTGAVIAGNGAPDGYGFFTRSQDGTKEWFAFAYNGAGTYMGSTTNDPLYFRTNNTNRGVIGASGALNWYGAVDFDSTLNVDGAATVGSLTVTGSCTGCGTSYWTRNGAGYVYPTTASDSVMIGSSGTPGAKLEVSGGGIKLGGSITFAIGSAYDLGTSSARAATVYSYYGNFTSTVTAGGLSLSGSITPSTSAAYDIGSTTYPFQNIYATQLIARNTTNSVNQVVIGGLTSTAIGFYNTSGTLTGYITRNGSYHGDYASMTGGYNAGPFLDAGITATITVRKGDDSGSCTITVTGGIITGKTC